MALAEKIYQKVQKLPEPIQSEVLDFIEFINSRRKDISDFDWSQLSLSSAMKGMEDEEGSQYTPSDLKEKFQ